MYKVLISDDEIRICKLIRNLIDWESLGAEVIGIANDGLSAYDMIFEKKPDIVITDIRMPGCDGLEMIRRVREKEINTDFIIISGYQQFDYAQKAIRYGVEDYILKPINERELTDMLRKVISQNDRKRSFVQNQERTEEELRKSNQLMKKNVLNDMLNNMNGAGTNSGALGMDEAMTVQAVLIKPDIDCNIEQFETYRALLQKTEEQADKVFTEAGCNYISTVKDEGVYMIFSLHDNEDIESKFRLVKRNLMVQNSAFFPKFTITVGVGERKDGMAGLPISIRDARHAMLNRIFLGTGEIIRRSDFRIQEPLKTEEIFTHSIRSRFLERIEVFDFEGLKMIIESIGMSSYKFKNSDGRFVERLSDMILTTYLFGTTALHDEKDTEDLKEKWRKTFLLCVTSKEVFEQLSLILEENLKMLLEQNNRAQAKPVMEAKAYLQEHYRESIRLEDISNMEGFNSTYFSTLFKKETGQNFSDYLIELRVNRAKILLTDSNLSVSDIAEEVGYQDLKYFSRIFKRLTGLNPTEYRRLYHKIG